MSVDPHKLIAERFAALMAAVRDQDGHARSAEDQQFLLDQLRGAMDRASDRLNPGQSGQIAGTFLVEDTIHTGAWHEVLKLRHRDLGTLHALKTLKPEEAHAVSRAELLRREAEIGLTLSHPRIVTTRMLLRLSDGRPAILQDWAGEPLTALPRPDAGQCRDIMTALLSALAYLHGLGLVHGDIAPGNLLLDEKGNIRLGDFGIALRQGETHAVLGLAQARPALVAADRQDAARPARAVQDLHASGLLLQGMLDGLEDVPEKLEHFQEKWEPVFRPEMCQYKKLERRSDSITSKSALTALAEWLIEAPDSAEDRSAVQALLLL
ncbi:protein kinase domain-containing protein [Rhizobium paknamense]|uniref:Type VI secretion system protein ImpN n=1 Tax=Rhizobium paknamense TaxID=1206817 RepID=A0ABU0IAB4_9HYPH|nr:protein kinase [Rhizobium paknamense]MDQ0454583.1 type VI secretion system protein ImpN [Rhizobium paknamense]